MSVDAVGRRAFLKGAASGVLGSAGLMAALPESAFGLEPGDPRVIHEVAEPGQDGDAKPKYSIKPKYR